MAKTRIGWTEWTWNPVTGCDRISAGCDNCYALSVAADLKAKGAKRYQTDGDPRTSGPGFGVALHPELLNQPKAWVDGRLILVNSMSDVFHAKVPLSYIQDIFATIADTPRHTYQVLTKRSLRLARLADKLEWPDNLWMGVSVEDMAVANRADHLREVPAAVRFISAEPLIGPIAGMNLAGIHQVITGGESGPNHRPIDADWVREIRDQCVAEDVAFFHKQWGGLVPDEGGNELDGRVWEEYPRNLASTSA